MVPKPGRSKKKPIYYMVYNTHYLGGVFVSFVYWAVF